MSKQEIKRIMDRFKKARDKRAQSRDEVWTELDAFDRGEQWALKGDAPAWTPKPVTNFIHLVKYTKRAALSIENPVGKIRSTSPVDRPLVDQMQKVYEFEWRKIGLRKYVREAIENAKLLGTAITQLAWEENFIGGGTGAKFEGRIVAKTIDPATFYPDPSAFTIEDCRFIHVVERKTIDFIKSVPQFSDKAKEVESTQNDATQDRGEIYNRDYNTSQKDVIDFHSHYEKVPNENGGYTYKVTYLANDVVLHVVEELKPQRYPFAILYDFKQRHDFWARSTCELILSNQKIVNKIESVIATIGLLLQNPQKIVSKESGINPKEVARFGNAHGHVYLANGLPSNAMTWQTPPQIPQALFSLLENAKQNIREITGLNEAYTGQSVGSLQTSSGVEQLIDRSTLRDRDQMFDVEMYVEDLSRLMLAFVSEFYTEERVMRIDVPDAPNEQDREQFVTFLGVDFADLDYDMEINVSAKAPISRMRQQQEMEKLLNMQGQYGYAPAVITPKEYMRISEFTDAEKIIARMDMDEMRNKVEEAVQVAAMISEGMEKGLPQEELYNLANQMFTQFDEQGGGIGNASNTDNIQQRQQGV